MQIGFVQNYYLKACSEMAGLFNLSLYIQSSKHFIMISKSIRMLTLLLLITNCGLKAQVANAFKKKIYISANDTMAYRLMYPENYNPKKHYPLLVYLHGAGERGNDNERQLYFVPAQLTDSAGRKNHPCFILAPQCPKTRLWVHYPKFPVSLQATPEPTLPAKWTFELIDQLIAKLSIDKRRIYITGYSMGGEGTFDFLTRKPDLFAAAIPICSVSDTAKAASISRIPVWAFHGDKDDVNDVKYSRYMIDALRKSGGKPKYTEYPGIGHNIVAKAYTEPGLYDWLFVQKKH